MVETVTEEKVPLEAKNKPFLVCGFLGAFWNLSYGSEDHLGSTRMVLDENGTVKEALMYQPYGTVSDVQGITIPGTDPLRQKFTTKEFDEEGDENGAPGIGLFYFGARYLDPDLGIWISRDPVDQYWNTFSYCGGDPVNYYDPDGQFAGAAWQMGALIGMAAGATIGGVAGGIYAERNGGKWYEGAIAGAAFGGFAGTLLGAGVASLGHNISLIPKGGSGIQAPNLFQRHKIEKLLQSIAGKSVKLVGKHLVMDDGSSTPAKSDYYKNRLNDGINAGEKIKIRIEDDMPNPNYEALKILEKMAKGTSLVPKRKAVAGGNYWMKTVRITGESFYLASEKMTVTAEEILMHELVGHAIPDIAGGGTGNAIENENIVRDQMGTKRRANDPKHIE